jgi:hypothetical protein
VRSLQKVKEHRGSLSVFEHISFPKITKRISINFGSYVYNVTPTLREVQIGFCAFKKTLIVQIIVMVNLIKIHNAHLKHFIIVIFTIFGGYLTKWEGNNL